MQGIRRARPQAGFTLVEMLVVLLVIAILAGIAIPVFLAQRNKARIAAAQRSLKDAALAAEAYGVANGGDYSGLTAADGLTKLEDNGFNPTASIEILVDGEPGTYCIAAQSHLMDPLHPWYYGSYEPAIGRPTEGYTCDDQEEGEEPPPEEWEDLPLEFPSLPECNPPLLQPPLCA